MSKLSEKAMSLMVASHTVRDYCSWEALWNYIAELEAESAELKPYRDGYDACENFPEEGVNVIAVAARDNWFLLAQRRGDKWYDSLGQQAEIRGGIERWWKLPEVQE